MHVAAVRQALRSLQNSGAADGDQSLDYYAGGLYDDDEDDYNDVFYDDEDQVRNTGIGEIAWRRAVLDKVSHSGFVYRDL